MDNVSTTSINDEKEEDLLWEEFKKTKSSKIRDKFIRQYMPLVKYVAGKTILKTRTNSFKGCLRKKDGVVR